MSFAAEIEAFANKSKANMSLVTRKVMMDIGAHLVERSPVGDASYWIHRPPPGYVGGRFRGNWQYGFNTAPPGDLPSIDPTGSASLARVAACVGSPGIHYIVNGLPYARRLEEGWSRQAPQGMVELTRIDFENIVDIAVQGVK